jgi:hypothetical protein
VLRLDGLDPPLAGLLVGACGELEADAGEDPVGEVALFELGALQSCGDQQPGCGDRSEPLEPVAEAERADLDDLVRSARDGPRARDGAVVIDHRTGGGHAGLDLAGVQRHHLDHTRPARLDARGLDLADVRVAAACEVRREVGLERERRRRRGARPFVQQPPLPRVPGPRAQLVITADDVQRHQRRGVRDQPDHREYRRQPHGVFDTGARGADRAGLDLVPDPLGQHVRALGLLGAGAARPEPHATTTQGPAASDGRVTLAQCAIVTASAGTRRPWSACATRSRRRRGCA